MPSLTATESGLAIGTAFTGVGVGAAVSLPHDGLSLTSTGVCAGTDVSVLSEDPSLAIEPPPPPQALSAPIMAAAMREQAIRLIAPVGIEERAARSGFRNIVSPFLVGLANDVIDTA